jgi:hypothetical protein
MPRKQKPKLVPGQDYIVDSDGRVCLTAHYLLSQGECCTNGCRYCPYAEQCGHHVSENQAAAAGTASASGRSK